MTIPVRVESANHRTADTPLPLPQSRAIGRRDAKLAEVMRDPRLSASAKVTYAAIFAMGEPRWLDLHTIAAAAGMTYGQVRRLVPKLVGVGLVLRMDRHVHNADGESLIRARYALAVTA